MADEERMQPPSRRWAAPAPAMIGQHQRERWSPVCGGGLGGGCSSSGPSGSSGGGSHGVYGGGGSCGGSGSGGGGGGSGSSGCGGSGSGSGSGGSGALGSGAGPSSSYSWLETGAVLGAMQAAARAEGSLPPTPRSPSPTCSPPLSPKRHRTHPEGSEAAAADSAADDEIEVRAAALGLNETTQRVWRETALPPTPSSPSPTFSPPSTPKPGDKPDFAEHAAAALAASLQPSSLQRQPGRATPFGGGPLSEGAKSASCDSDSDSLSMAAYEVSGSMHPSHQPAHQPWEAAARHNGKKRMMSHST
mmetsp:Transcript_5230/g.17003  ORF Transcript_5230/g.17003 Transcript_5230/m.17003 type:complete len:304 (-) Transcript_5230:32-943(-)